MTREFHHPITLELGDTEASHDALWSADEAANVTLEQVRLGTKWVSATLITECVGKPAVQRQTEIAEEYWRFTGYEIHEAEQVEAWAEQRMAAE